MTESFPPPVTKRLVIHVGGFDPVTPERLNHRMSSGISKLAELWSFEARAGDPDVSSDGRLMSWRIEATGPNWTTVTEFVLLRWDDLIGLYIARPRWRKLLDGYAAISHFMMNGTVSRYFSGNWRYGLFVLYPFFMLIGFGLFAYFAGKTVTGFELPLGFFWGAIAGLLIFAAALVWLGQYFQLYFALADWSFAADLVRDKAPGLSQCLDQFAEEIVRRVRACAYDEVVLSGVSLGAVMMVEALARALRIDPELGRRDASVAFMTIGSSLLKIGLHPEASSLRASVAAVSSERSLLWIEYQSKVDPINFFGTNPVEQMGLPPTGRPIVRTMRIRETMTPEEYRYLRVNFLRLHRQFAMPNSRRYHYDFYLICFGPMPIRERVRLDRYATAAIGEDGSYRSVAPPSRGGGIQTAMQRR